MDSDVDAAHSGQHQPGDDRPAVRQPGGYRPGYQPGQSHSGERQPAEYQRLAESVQSAGDMLARFGAGLADLIRSWKDGPGRQYLDHYARPMANELTELERTVIGVDKAIGAINRILAEQENTPHLRPWRDIGPQSRSRSSAGERDE